MTNALVVLAVNNGWLMIWCLPHFDVRFDVAWNNVLVQDLRII